MWSAMSLPVYFAAYGELGNGMTEHCTIEALLPNSDQVIGVLLLQKGAHLLNPRLHTICVYVRYQS